MQSKCLFLRCFEAWQSELFEAILSGAHIEMHSIYFCIMVQSFLLDFADEMFHLTQTMDFGPGEETLTNYRPFTVFIQNFQTDRPDQTM